MATKSEEIIWRGIPLRVETDTGTGRAKVYLKSNNLLVMQTDTNNASKWDYTSSGLETLKGAFNKANPDGKIQPGENFSRDFVWANGIQEFNAARATTLNDTDNFTGTPEEIKKRQQDLVQETKVPGVIDPVTKETVSTDGTVIAGAAPPPPEDEQSGEEPPPEEEEVNPNYTITPGTSKEFPSVTAKDLRYPLGSPPAGFPFDFIRISAYKYVPSSLDYITVGREGGDSVEDRYPVEQEMNSVILPMQPNLSESHAVGWGGDALDPFRASLANASFGAMNAVSSGEAMAEKLLGVGSDLLKNLGSALMDPATRSFTAAYFAGQAVGANITGRQTGQVINPNMELLFSGPTLRTFNFNFRMTPRSDTEADMIKKIIRSFKMNMAVQRSDSNLFLRTPNIFRLKYIASEYSDTNVTDQHPFLNKFKPCAMTGFNVNYTPDGSYMTYDNKSLTAYDMSLSFSELEPIYQDDYADSYNNHADMGY